MSEELLMRSRAVARQSGGNAGVLLTKYINTNPTMALNHTTPEPAAAAAPKGAGGAVDPTQR